MDSGAPEGKPEDLPPKPTFNDSWQFGQPDIVFDIGEDFTVPPGNDVYQYFTVPTNFTEGKWIRAAQILPGNRQIVHHVHVSVVVDKKETPPWINSGVPTRRREAFGRFTTDSRDSKWTRRSWMMRAPASRRACKL